MDHKLCLLEYMSDDNGFGFGIGLDAEYYRGSSGRLMYSYTSVTESYPKTNLSCYSEEHYNHGTADYIIREFDTWDINTDDMVLRLSQIYKNTKLGSKLCKMFLAGAIDKDKPYCKDYYYEKSLNVMVITFDGTSKIPDNLSTNSKGWTYCYTIEDVITYFNKRLESIKKNLDSRLNFIDENVDKAKSILGILSQNENPILPSTRKKRIDYSLFWNNLTEDDKNRIIKNYNKSHKKKSE